MSATSSYPSMDRVYEIADTLDDDRLTDEERLAEAKKMAQAELDDAGPRLVTAHEFGAVAEAGAEPLIGTPGQVLIPVGGDVMVYGDGGASKTTLGIDLA